MRMRTATLAAMILTLAALGLTGCGNGESTPPEVAGDTMDNTLVDLAHLAQKSFKEAVVTDRIDQARDPSGITVNQRDRFTGEKHPLGTGHL